MSHRYRLEGYFYDGASLPQVGSVIVFDIGGTWFRRAVINPKGELSYLSRQPAINYINYPDMNIRELQNSLVQYLVNEVHYLLKMYPEENLRVVGISMGAALNAHTGLILSSGPLWGPMNEPFDLLGALYKLEPIVQWFIVNDITAALLRHLTEFDNRGLHKITLVTVSSGIGCRTFDQIAQKISVDSKFGLQGEIGHLPIDFSYIGHHIHRNCDCGGKNHLNAFCSGRGIDSILPYIATLPGIDFSESLLSRFSNSNPEALTFTQFAEAVTLNDPLSISILDAVTFPMAMVLLNLFTIDPEVEKVFFVGGVVNALEEKYLNSLHKHLHEIGLYQISTYDPFYFENKLCLGATDDFSGLYGAAIAIAQNIGVSMPGTSNVERQIWYIKAKKSANYIVAECDGIFDLENPILFNDTNMNLSSRRFVVVDEMVYRLYASDIEMYFQKYSSDYQILVLSVSEEQKTIGAVLDIMDALSNFGLSRRSEPIIAIGGGVLLDIAGFAANLYRRGTPYFRVPTTLLAMVDASVGVKTGVNFKGFKNRIGTYYPPIATFIDTKFLHTLATREIRSGLAEILKIALIRDLELFELLEKHGGELIRTRFQEGDIPLLVIRRAIQGMLEELEDNLWEQNLERFVDFGHSFSPLLEMQALPELLHGEAVSLDMALSVILSYQRNLLTLSVRERILNLTRNLGLPILHELCEPSILYQALQNAAQHRNGLQRLPLPVGVGAMQIVNDITLKEITNAVLILQELARVDL